MRVNVIIIIFIITARLVHTPFMDDNMGRRNMDVMLVFLLTVLISLSTFYK